MIDTSPYQAMSHAIASSISYAAVRPLTRPALESVDARHCHRHPLRVPSPSHPRRLYVPLDQPASKPAKSTQPAPTHSPAMLCHISPRRPPISSHGLRDMEPPPPSLSQSTNPLRRTSAQKTKKARTGRLYSPTHMEPQLQPETSRRGAAGPSGRANNVRMPRSRMGQDRRPPAVCRTGPSSLGGCAARWASGA
jgi:hypothetical protein